VVTSPHWVGCYDFIKQAQPDLVILDLMMGRDQTGWAVLDLLRSESTTREIPVILCSAAATALDQHAAYLRGQPAVASITKPFDVDDLLAAIERMLQGARATTA
jgi:CheY-like chemotaxis protein